MKTKEKKKGKIIQFHGPSGIDVFKCFVEIIIVEEDETGDEPKRKVVSDKKKRNLNNHNERED